jgi:hypothetical protein
MCHERPYKVSAQSDHKHSSIEVVDQGPTECHLQGMSGHADRVSEHKFQQAHFCLLARPCPDRHLTCPDTLYLQQF